MENNKDKKTKKELDAEEKRILQNAAILRTMPDNIGDALAKARSKPVWCSDIRWRMELSRRKRRNFY